MQTFPSRVRILFCKPDDKRCSSQNQTQWSADTLTTLRESYWILRGREATKRIIKQCIICRKFDGVPFKPQPTPDLPDMRVADAPPFTFTGLDFAGPLYITSSKKDSQTKFLKRLTSVYTLVHQHVLSI